MPEQLPEALDVIAVGAHPDDVEIACGGTLASLVRQGYRIGIVDLTDGEPTPRSPGPEVRLAEAAEAAGILGIQERITLELPNRRLFDGFDERVALAKVFRRFRPKIVLGIGGKTPLASPDHWQAMQITDAAVFYSRLTKWDEKFDNLPVHTISKLVWYPLALKSLSMPENSGAFVMDISETFDVKLESIRAYRTQFPPEKERVFDMVRGINGFFGAGAGFKYGEVFLSSTTIGTNDLVRTVLPPVGPVDPK
ncbi:PIG-L family deacetylase [Stratiformator vulcanicus]|uniref:Mycothiol S-conjugate amidase n=1 Tax=Stratiformator vulcanicus TaxID=2527980 RepID=A0A517R3P0_9PLAN|nr:PIG-L family deacetylase [Stratiformator vulcanicus]QDT38460.1 Mycothiol S-conjugate amidase [Stratiformator vulcanicus]